MGGSLHCYMVVYEDGAYASGFCMAHSIDHIRKYLAGSGRGGELVTFYAKELSGRLHTDVWDVLVERQLDFNLGRDGREL